MLTVTGIEADYDSGQTTIADATAVLRQHGVGGIIYSTPSHVPEHPRWRLLLPLSRAHTPAERDRFAAMVNGMFEGQLDEGATFGRSQSMYFGAVDGSAPLTVELVAGAPLDLVADLPSRPRSSRQAAAETDDAVTDDDWSWYKPDPDWTRINAALSHIPPHNGLAGGGARAEWVEIGMALHHASDGSDEGQQVFLDWSRGWPKCKPREVRQQWRSFRDERGGRSITVATLFEIAKGYGWDAGPSPGGAATPEEASPHPKATASLALIDPVIWHDQDLPERQWALRDWIPAGQATYLTGRGSAGKSLLAQQLATCIALGLPFLGIETAKARALYLTCEDDVLELHRRQKAICAMLNISLEQLSGRLFLASLAGETDTELCTFTDKGELRPTARYAALEGDAKAAGITFIALDNVAHIFAGNENARHDVASFLSLLNRLAIKVGGTVLFIGHPNKAGDSFSGSTAWENQVRSRLFMEAPETGDDGPVGRDARVLSRQKANYARNGETVKFRWHSWAFARDADLPFSVSAEAQAKLEDEVFMACLAKTAEERRNVSPAASASNYAPRIFSKMPTGEGVSIAGFERALQRLLHRGEVLNDQPVFKRANRSWARGLGPAQRTSPAEPEDPFE